MTVTVITNSGGTYKHLHVGTIQYSKDSGQLTITFKSPTAGWLNAYFKATDISNVIVSKN